MKMIGGVSAEEYAASWGCDPCYDRPPRKRGDGYYFYNFGSKLQKRTREWLVQFADAIKRTIKGLKEGNDKNGLRSLHLYVLKLAYFAKFDEFTQGYITCALWAETDSDGKPFDQNYEHVDIHINALHDAIADCKRFQEENAETLKVAYEHYAVGNWTPESQAGHDLWLSRNGHGVGFWSRGLPDDIGNALTVAAAKFGQRNLYVGDNGWLYL